MAYLSTYITHIQAKFNDHAYGPQGALESLGVKEVFECKYISHVISSSVLEVNVLQFVQAPEHAVRNMNDLTEFYIGGKTAEQPPILFRMTGKQFKQLLKKQPGAAGVRDRSLPVRKDPVRPD